MARKAKRKNHNLHPKGDDSSEIEKGSLGFVELLSEARSIFLYGTFDERMAVKFHMAMMQLERVDSDRPIKIFIHSTGGFLNSCFYMIDVMQNSKCPIYTIACGYAYSAACLLLAAGDPGNRYAFPNSMLMIHEPSGTIQGSFSQVEVERKDLAETVERMVELIAAATGKTRPSVRQALKQDTYFSAPNAMRFGPRGLVDGIWPPDADI